MTAVVLAAACAPGKKGRPARPDRASQILRARLSAPPPVPAARDAKAAETWSAVRRLYETTGGHPLWLVDGRPRREIAVLRDSIRRAAEDGLNPSDYDLRAADTLQSSGRGLFKRGGDLEPLIDADVRLSYTFLKFARHLERGRVPPGQVDAHWFGTQRDEDLVQALKVALESGRLRESLEKLEPQHAQYAALKKVLARYREVAAAGGWSVLPAGWTPRAGRPDPGVALLRAHLIATGDLA
ncbi:MAG TPA: hypothetical protein VEQ84_14470, partial [Vicinamibacteria bacterium]|nr:hypothetical protein [Vicinamibacteria bacterium]